MGLVCKYIFKSENGKRYLYYLFRDECKIILCNGFIVLQI